MNQHLTVYACGSPIRQAIMQSIAKGSPSNQFIPDPNPIYQGGNSIIWGLIRGADKLMEQTKASGNDFYQIDNGYFGRNIYYRMTKNQFQLTEINHCDDMRYKKIFSEIGFSILPWQEKRTGPIVICLSSSFLFGFYKINIDQYLQDLISKIRTFTDRPIVIREKFTEGIDQAINDAWCVITHVSASALDALRLGIPVITTGYCAATPLATPIDQINDPYMPDHREALFASLAWGQFTQSEFESGFAWKAIQNIR
jgi:hypothetical protein